MSCIDFLLERFDASADSAALVWKDQTFSYRWLSERVGHWTERLFAKEVKPGTIVALESDFSPNSVALWRYATPLTRSGCLARAPLKLTRYSQ